MIPVSPASRPVFVVGAPRSGTHLMRFCLARHSAIAMSPETGFFIQAYGSRVIDRLVPRAQRWPLLIDRMIARSGDPTMAQAAERRDDLVRATAECQGYGDFGGRFMAALANSSGKPRWGEKTTYHVFCLPQIFALFPDAQVLFMRRNTKSTIASTLKSGHVRLDFDKALALSLKVSGIALRYATDPRVHLVHYEELTADPEAVLRTLCAFLGEDFETAMLKPGMVDSSYASGVMNFDQSIGIQPDDPTKWRTALSQAQADLIDALEATPPSLSTPPAIRREQRRLGLRFAAVRAGVFGLRRALHDHLRGGR